MRTSIRILGVRIPTAKRSDRRVLVAVFYLLNAAFLVTSWHLTRNPHRLFFWPMIFATFTAPILGGRGARGVTMFGGGGVLEPDDRSKVLHYPSNFKGGYWQSLFHPEVDSDPGLRIDERGIRSREQAGYKAFGILSTLIVIAAFIEWIGGEHDVFWGLGMTVEQSRLAIGVLIQICYVLATTLTEAIQLWTEPDIDEGA